MKEVRWVLEGVREGNATSALPIVEVDGVSQGGVFDIPLAVAGGVRGVKLLRDERTSAKRRELKVAHEHIGHLLESQALGGLILELMLV